MPKRELVIVRHHGQITIPKPIRDKLGIEEGSILEVRVKDNKIIMEIVK